VIEEAMNRQGAVGPLHIVWKGVAPGSVTTALEALRMAKDPRSVPKDRTGRPRTVARRGRIGSSPPNTESRRSTNHCGGHTYTAQGQVARLVERKSVIQSDLANTR
jgi:hypothetical protein